MPNHVFTSLAPEDNIDGESSSHLETWKWCIRCGILRLGRKYFKHSKTQKLIIEAEDTTPSCI